MVIFDVLVELPTFSMCRQVYFLYIEALPAQESLVRLVERESSDIKEPVIAPSCWHLEKSYHCVKDGILKLSIVQHIRKRSRSHLNVVCQP